MSVSRARKDAMAIFRAGVKAVDPVHAIKRHLKKEGNLLVVGEKTYDLSSFDKISVIGTGKASAAMARAVEELFGEIMDETDKEGNSNA